MKKANEKALNAKRQTDKKKSSKYFAGHTRHIPNTMRDTAAHALSDFFPVSFRLFSSIKLNVKMQQQRSHGMF